MKKTSSKILVTMCIISAFLVGCSSQSNDGKSTESESSQYNEQITQNNLSTKEIENDVPYIDSAIGQIDDCVINERYENVKKEELTYSSIYDNTGEGVKDNDKSSIVLHLAKSIENDVGYKDILLGFTYPSEGSSINLTYDEAIELVKKVLPDDIEKFKTVLDTEVNKEYIYYKSEKGNFRVGLTYGSEFDSNNIEQINKNTIVGIDYSREIKK